MQNTKQITSHSQQYTYQTEKKDWTLYCISNRCPVCIQQILTSNSTNINVNKAHTHSEGDSRFIESQHRCNTPLSPASSPSPYLLTPLYQHNPISFLPISHDFRLSCRQNILSNYFQLITPPNKFYPFYRTKSNFYITFEYIVI